MISDQDILKKIGQQPKSTAGYKQLVRELGLGGGQERRELGERVGRNVAQPRRLPRQLAGTRQLEEERQ